MWSGVARLDRRTKNLTKRLCPGEIAIIDHVDLDRVSAEALIRRQVAAVVNAAASISGRYPEPRAGSCWSRPASRSSTTSGPDVFARSPRE